MKYFCFVITSALLWSCTVSHESLRQADVTPLPVTTVSLPKLEDNPIVLDSSKSRVVFLDTIVLTDSPSNPLFSCKNLPLLNKKESMLVFWLKNETSDTITFLMAGNKCSPSWPKEPVRPHEVAMIHVNLFRIYPYMKEFDATFRCIIYRVNKDLPNDILISGAGVIKGVFLD